MANDGDADDEAFWRDYDWVMDCAKEVVEVMREIQMSDIVERLRSSREIAHWPMIGEAADEIERLRAIADTVDIMTAQTIKRQNDEIERLRGEFDRLQRGYDQLRDAYINTGMSQNPASNDEGKRDMDLIKRLREAADARLAALNIQQPTGKRDD